MSNLLTYTFTIEGHGQKLNSGLSIRAKDEKAAIKQALKHCTHFEMDGWTLICNETRTGTPIVPARKGKRR